MAVPCLTHLWRASGYANDLLFSAMEDDDDVIIVDAPTKSVPRIEEVLSDGSGDAPHAVGMPKPAGKRSMIEKKVYFAKDIETTIFVDDFTRLVEQYDNRMPQLDCEVRGRGTQV